MRHLKASVALFCALSTYIGGYSAIAYAQAPPAGSAPSSGSNSGSDIGALPFIIIVTDTSGSTENTTDPAHPYPYYGKSTYTDKSTNLGVSDLSGNPTVGRATDPSSFIGPCATWEPDSCAEYERPTHYFNENNNYGPQLDLSYSNPRWRKMSERMAMAFNDSTGRYRLTDDNSPKQIKLKEILTGDMLLAPPGTTDYNTLDPNTYGPSCWLVPRMGGESSSHMDKYCKNSGNFTHYPDYQATTPHYQEVFNHQLKNGLLDSLGRSAVFAFTGLDSVADSASTPNYNDPYPDYSYLPYGRTQAKESDRFCHGPANGPCYNLGVRKIIGPTSLKGLTLSSLGSISEYVQQAILDTGYLKKPFTNPQISVRGTDPNLRYQFGREDYRFLDNLPLGDQPIFKATPLAAAVYDVATYLTVSKTDRQYPLNQNNDPYFQCRDKHILLFSDGSPAPERPDLDVNSDIGSEYLSSAFNYSPKLFPYDSTAQEISFLRQTRPLGGNPPQVHIIALLDKYNPLASTQEKQTREAQLRKLDKMAASGGTCASVALDPSWISTTKDPRQCKRNGGRAANLGKACLDTSSRGSFGSNPVPSYTYTIPGTTKVLPCKYPALVLTDNNRADLEAALAETFNNIIQQAGIKSRTRTVYSNDLESYIMCGTSTYNKETGVNEFLSGLVTGGSPYWGGLLYRKTYACGCNPDLKCTGSNPAVANPKDVLNLSDEINMQVKKSKSGIYTDNRRVFTSLLANGRYNYPNIGGGNTYQPIPTSQPLSFFQGWVPFNNTGRGYPFYGATPSGMTTSTAGKPSLELESLFLKASPFFNNTAAGKQRLAMFLGLPASSSDGQINNVFNILRARTIERDTRVLGAIYNGNPVAVDPPSLDIPIASYAAFKQKYANRPPVLFVPTTDGLIHAIYSGDGEGLNAARTNIEGVIIQRNQRRANDSISNNNSPQVVTNKTNSQREAWAYLPFTLLSQLASSQGANPYLIDGTPTVKDVRLCNGQAKYNFNDFACGTQDVPPENQWRTLLVQGFGLAGKGYVALDVTYEGGRMDPNKPQQSFPPEPRPLWEFNPITEQIQATHISSKSNGRNLIGSSLLPCGSRWGGTQIDWNFSLMGNSISDPAIGTLLVQTPTSTGNLQRPVVLFGGGEMDPAEPSKCYGRNGNLSGRAIYIMDAQTGSILRRFVSYKASSSSSGETLFKDAITGSPTFYNDFTGSIATRAFIGDSKGRLYKIDLTDPDPAQWQVYLFFDPANSDKNWIPAPPPGRHFGAANYPPAISKLPDGNLMVVYGLGEVGDRIDPESTQLIIALRDQISPPTGTDVYPVKRYDNDPEKNDSLWFVQFNKNEKLTGAPFIFDNVVYYPTFQVTDAENLCDPGEPHINRVYLEGNQAVVETTNFEKTKDRTVIRGLSLRIDPCCGGDNAPPELVAQTGGNSLTQKSITTTKGGASTTTTPTTSATGTTAKTGQLTTFRQRVKNPSSQSIPLAWTHVIN